MDRLPHIILIGLMGSGKSSVGRYLAKRNRWLYSDIDTMVETYFRRTIADIFAEDGEAGFRTFEEEMVELAVNDHKPGVIATGGGAILSKKNRSLMKKNGFTVYLQASPEALYERTRRDTSRPLLQNEDPLKTLKSLLKSREKYYKTADLILSVENRPIRSVSSEIWSSYKSAYPNVKEYQKKETQRLR